MILFLYTQRVKEKVKTHNYYSHFCLKASIFFVSKMDSISELEQTHQEARKAVGKRILLEAIACRAEALPLFVGITHRKEAKEVPLPTSSIDFIRYLFDIQEMTQIHVKLGDAMDTYPTVKAQNFRSNGTEYCAANGICVRVRHGDRSTMISRDLTLKLNLVDEKDFDAIFGEINT